MTYVALKFATIAAAVLAVAHIPQYAADVLADVAGRM